MGGGNKANFQDFFSVNMRSDYHSIKPFEA